MSDIHNKLSVYNEKDVPKASTMKFGIIVSEWNPTITDALYKGCIETLLHHNVEKENIFTLKVPGSFELISGAQMLAVSQQIDCVICIGCIIKGETKHNEYIAQGVANGLAQLSIQYSKPFIFGVLTTNNMKQAVDRSGGKFGNKGVESAVTAIKMAALQNKFR